MGAGPRAGPNGMRCAPGNGSAGISRKQAEGLQRDEERRPVPTDNTTRAAHTPHAGIGRSGLAVIRPG